MMVYITTQTKRFSEIIITITALFVLAFAFQGSRGIYSPDEGFYVSIAQSMVDTGDYLTPRLQYEPWLDKPPLSLWGSAAGLWLLGHNEWGARLFHAICYILTVWLVFLLGQSMYSKREGLLAGVIYATMFFPFIASNIVTPDTPLALWTTASFYCFWKSVEPDARHVGFWKLFLCAAFGLGFLTKGPAALIPAGVMFFYLVIQGRTLRWYLTWWAIPGFILFCALGLSWYAYIAFEFPGALAYFWDNQVFGRTVSAKYDRNTELYEIFIYLPVILGGTLPWSLAWWPALWRNRKDIFDRVRWRKRLSIPANLLLTLWIAIFILVLCLASSRLPLYALPIFPAFAITASRLRLFQSSNNAWSGNQLHFSPRGVGYLTLWFIFLIGFKWYVAYCVPSERDMRALYTLMQSHLPNETYEIVAVKDHLEGLGFYDRSLVERVTTKERPYPFFILPEHVTEEIQEMQSSNYAHVFILDKERRAETLRTLFNTADITYQETKLTYDRHLFVCKPSRKDHHIVRLAVLGDTGKGKGRSRHISVVSAMRLVYGAKSFDDGVLMLGDNLFSGEADIGNPTAVARREFEKPFASLLKTGVPFYAVLGNHDYKYGLQSFELTYPLFHMQDRRYYTKTFGDGLVKIFSWIQTLYLAKSPNRIQVK